MLRKMRVFRHYQIWKGFTMWRANVRAIHYNRVRAEIGTQLLACTMLATPAASLRSLVRLRSSGPHNITVCPHCTVILHGLLAGRLLYPAVPTFQPYMAKISGIIQEMLNTPVLSVSLWWGAPTADTNDEPVSLPQPPCSLQLPNECCP